VPQVPLLGGGFGGSGIRGAASPDGVIGNDVGPVGAWKPPWEPPPWRVEICG